MATRRAFGGLPQERALWAGFAQPGVCPVCSSAVPSGRHAAPWLVCALTAPWGDMGDSSSPASPRAHAGFGHHWALLVALRVGQRQPCPREGRECGRSGAPPARACPQFSVFLITSHCPAPLAPGGLSSPTLPLPPASLRGRRVRPRPLPGPRTGSGDQACPLQRSPARRARLLAHFCFT